MGYTRVMYFLIRLRRMGVGIDLSIVQVTSWRAREMDFLRASRGEPEATAVDGVRLIRTREMRSLMPGPVGRMAKIMACRSPQDMNLSRVGVLGGGAGGGM